jgi:protein XagA
VPRIGVKLLLLLSAALIPEAAGAGAWLMPEGHGQVAVIETVSAAGKAFDASGAPQSTPRYNKTEVQVLIEYGLSDWLTAMAIPSVQRVDIAAPINADRTGMGNSEIGARARVLQESNWVMSVQGTLRLPGSYDAGNPAAVGYTGFDVDLRALFGVSFALGGLPSFVDLQVAQRFRTGGPPSEARVDLTLGLRAAQQWLVLLQQFNVFSEGAGGALFPAYKYHKLQMSVIYDITPKWSLQGGAFTTFAGKSALQENGVLTGVWYRF